MKNQKSYEDKMLKKDEKEFSDDPFRKLNKAKTKRLEEAFFAQMQFEEEYPREDDFIQFLPKKRTEWEKCN